MFLSVSEVQEGFELQSIRIEVDGECNLDLEFLL